MITQTAKYVQYFKGKWIIKLHKQKVKFQFKKNNK